MESFVRAASADVVLAGGGKMGALMRTVDWSATPLGPVSSWPQSLRTTVSTCLESRFPMLVWWGRDLVMLYNDAYQEIIGAKHPRALGAPGRTIFPEIWEIIDPMLRSVLDRGDATWSEDQLLELERFGYAEECYFTFAYSPIRDESGEVGGVLTVVSETTQRVIGERRLATLRALAEQSGTAHSVDDAVTRAAAVLADNPADLPFALVYQFDADTFDARLAGAARAAEAPSATLWPLEQAARESRAIPVALTDAPNGVREALALPIMRPGQDRPYGVLVAGVSPRRRLDDSYFGFLDLVAGHLATGIANAEAYEAERRRAEALAQLDRAKTAFFANVSHEFRTPLTLMLGPTEDLINDPSLATTQRERIDIVHRNTLRLHRLVNTLLEFSRIEAGRADAHYEAVDLGAFTAELASSFRSALERAGLELRIDVTALPGSVYVDKAMWEKIVLNLLSNAFKHTFEGGIDVTVRERDGAAELTVRDTGIGIAADQLPRLFERFYRVPTTRARTFEGTGIGLALVQELVRLHGGRIDVASEEGVGSSFTVRIPLGTSHLPASQLGPPRTASAVAQNAAPFVEEALRWLPEHATPEAATALGQPLILLADDNADMRDYVARLLRDEGWRVETVSDGRQAIERARRIRPSLIITDVMMPVMDGFEVLQSLRSDPELSTVPVILLSARAGEESRIEGLERGADDYLVKPFSARELVARVHAHLHRSEMRTRLGDLVRRAPAFICVLRGPDHVFEIANDAYAQLVGFRPIIGRSVRDVIPEATEQGFIELLDRVLATGEAFIGEELPVTLQTAPGSPPVTRMLSFVYQPITEPDGSRSGIFVHGVDVTEHVQARAEAQGANRAKSDFLAAMSHELRTPLNAIGGYAELMSIGVYGNITLEQKQSLDRIQQSSQHLLALINDILNFAKLEAGRVEYAIQPTSLADAVAAVRAMVDPQLTAKSLRLTSDISDTRVAADPEKLQQILINLLSNAVKFTDPGGSIAITSFRVVTEDGASHAELRVRDTGIGIPAERHASIFDPFVQVHRNLTRNTHGTGLGLTISRDLARGMGGDLTVTSAPGEGSTFTLSLPLAGH